MREWRASIADGHNKLSSWLETTVTPSKNVDDYVGCQDLKTDYVLAHRNSAVDKIKPKECNRAQQSTIKAWFQHKVQFVYKETDKVKDSEGNWKSERGVIRYCCRKEAVTGTGDFATKQISS